MYISFTLVGMHFAYEGSGWWQQLCIQSLGLARRHLRDLQLWQGCSIIGGLIKAAA